MDGNEAYQVNTNIVLRVETDDWALLFDPDSGDVVGINPVGVVVWRCLEKRLPFHEIILALTSSFDAVPDTVEKDVREFIGGLIRRGFITEV